MSEEPETPNSSEPVTPETPPVETPPEALTNKPEPEVVAPSEPVTVDTLVIPEGLEVPEAARDKFLEILNGELSPTDRANALLTLQKETLEQAAVAAEDAFGKTQSEWQAEVKADPDVGGDKLQPTLTNIAKLIDEYGNQELRDVFAVTGAGNNVHVIKFLSKLSEQLTESQLAIGSPTASPDSTADKLYPSMKKG